MRELTQAQLAEKAGIPAGTISHFENEVRKPSFDNLVKLAEALAVTTDFLLGRETELTGELTIRGVTKTVTFETEFGGQAVDPFGMTRAGFSATTTISRKDFGLTWNAALEAGGVLVSDKVKIDLDVAFVHQGE